MMSVNQCRAKARAARRSADQAFDAEAKAGWETIAREWDVLAGLAKIQGALKRAVAKRRPRGRPAAGAPKGP